MACPRSLQVQRTLPFGSYNAVIQGLSKVVTTLQFVWFTIDVHLGSFQLGALSNSAAVSILVCTFKKKFFFN